MGAQRGLEPLTAHPGSPAMVAEQDSPPVGAAPGAFQVGAERDHPGAGRDHHSGPTTQGSDVGGHRVPGQHHHAHGYALSQTSDQPTGVGHQVGQAGQADGHAVEHRGGPEQERGQSGGQHRQIQPSVTAGRRDVLTGAGRAAGVVDEHADPSAAHVDPGAAHAAHPPLEPSPSRSAP